MHRISQLQPGHHLQGPAILLDEISTIVVEPGCRAHLTAAGDVRIDVVHGAADKDLDAGTCDPVQLGIFSHRCLQLRCQLHGQLHQRLANLALLPCRFMGIAEQMGRMLQRTSVSVNIKERLDFSCALFSPAGDLVANAPHVPVHLGAMSEAVRFQV